MMWLGSIWMAAAAWAGCSFDYENKLADAAAALDAVDAAGDAEAILVAVQGASTAVECLGVPITPDLAGRFHRAMALSTDVHGLLSAEDADQPTVYSLAASYALDPEARHGVSLPSEHAHFASTAFVERSFDDAPSPADGSLVFDGMVTLQRPTNTAVFFQRLDAGGKVVSSAYLYPDNELPRYEARPAEPVPMPAAEPVVAEAPPLPADALETASASEPQRSKRPLLRAVGAGLGVGALGALGVNMAAYRGAMSLEGSSASQASERAGLVNALGATAIVLGVGATGTLGASFIVE